ncbi:hypothetical protein J3E69DRAFT_338099 [Trichoderma sp. SZMC 28015]
MIAGIFRYSLSLSSFLFSFFFLIVAFYIGVWGVELAFFVSLFSGGLSFAFRVVEKGVVFKGWNCFLGKKGARGESRHLLENGVLTFDWRDTPRLTADVCL